MIEFELTPDQRRIQEFAHQFAEFAVRPISLQADRDHRIPDAFMQRLADMRKLMSMGEVPREYGGEGAGAAKAKTKRARRRKTAPRSLAPRKWLGATSRC